MAETIVFSEYFKKYNSSSKIIFEGNENCLKIKHVGPEEIKILKSDSYEIYIDDIDKDIFKIECIEFKNCSFKYIYFESFEDGRQNVLLLMCKNQDNNEIQRNIKPDFKSKTTKENLHYPKLYFEKCTFEYFKIKKAEVDYENNEVSSEYVKSHVFFTKTIFNYDLHIKACEFKFEIEIIDANINSKFYFEDINFSKTFKISKSNFNKNINFKNIVFDGVVLTGNSYEEIQMEKVNFTKEILFFNNEIIKKAYFKNMIIDKTDINNIIELEFKCKENSEVEFSECFVYRKIIFIGCFYRVVLGIKFHEDVYFKNIFHDDVFFEDINFNNKQILSVNQFKKEVSFFEVSFNDGMEIEDDFLQEKNISFKSCQFKKIIAFREKNIKNITFGTCTFEQGVYFVSCIFSNANFYNCNFNNAACFYGSTFNMAPNFSQSVFKDSPNLVNIKAKFDFQNLNTTIENIYKPKDEAANDFRDSFRTFKSALIKDNNLLDASNFHKYELYCKEIELKNKKAITFKDIVDRYQLFFYRKLCDHHTDLLKAFHNLLIVIMLFGMFSFVLDKFKQPSHIENDIKYNIVKVDSNENYIFKEHNKTTYNLLSLNIEQEIQDLDISKFCFTFTLGLLFAVVILSNANCLWFLFLLLLEVIVFYIGLPKSIFSHLLIILSFACLFVFILVLDDEFERFLFVSISYAVCIFILLAKPSLLLPIFGSFLDKDSNATYPLLLSLFVVYFILVVLVLFSLQKTARKNSIVPS